jgi:hypothetical protein
MKNSKRLHKKLISLQNKFGKDEGKSAWIEMKKKEMKNATQSQEQAS